MVQPQLHHGGLDWRLPLTGTPPHCSLSKPKMDLRGQGTSNMWLNPKELESKICPSPPTPAHHMQSNTLKPPTHNPCTLSTNQHTETPTHTHSPTRSQTQVLHLSHPPLAPAQGCLHPPAHSHSPQIPRCSPGLLGGALTSSRLVIPPHLPWRHFEP